MKRTGLMAVSILSLLTSSPTMAQLTATVHPGYQFTEGERPSTGTLNQLGQPTIDISGTVSGTVGLAAGSVTGTHLADNVPDGRTLDYTNETPRKLEVKGGGITYRELAELPREDVAQFAAGTLSANVYAVTLSPAATAYTAGMVVRFKADVAPTAVDPGVNVNGLGAKTIKKNGTAQVVADINAGQLVQVVYDGVNFQLQSMSAYASVEPALASGRNIVAKNNVGIPNSIVDVSFDELVLKINAGGTGSAVVSSGGISANMASSGAGGLDTGVEANSTWYYIWVIYNSSTAAKAVILSLQNVYPPGPTMPAGYTYRALVGAVYNNFSGNFEKFYQRDRMVWVNEGVVFTAQAGSTTYTSQSLSPLVPPIAVRAWGAMGLSVAQNKGMAVAADANGMGACVVSGSVAGPGATDSFWLAGRWDVPLSTSQTVFWLSQDTASSYRLTVSGYQF